jgi:hypothetical protein
MIEQQITIQGFNKPPKIFYPNFFFSISDVHQTLAEKELEARRKVLEERRLREEARLASLSTTSPS